MLDHQPFIPLDGEVHNFSSSSLEHMEPVWRKAEVLGMNCLLLPVTWELVEPEDGQYVFLLIQGLIDQARAHSMKIAFLWFGTWKNAQCYYAPAEVKTNSGAFAGRKSKREKGSSESKIFTICPSPSYLCEETMYVDARTFG